MALQWTTRQAGVLKGNLSGVANKISVKGISGNAIMTTPESAVDTVNIILDIGGKAMVADEELTYDQTNGVINNG